MTNHFFYREICDDDKMEMFFWRTLNKYRPRFLTLLEIQGIHFDPMVNKYLEAENTDKAQRTASGSSTNSGDNTRTGNSTTNATDKGTMTEEGDSARLTSESNTAEAGTERTSSTTAAENSGHSETSKDGRTSTGTRLNDANRINNRTTQGTTDETTAATGGYSDVTEGTDASKSRSDGRTREAAKQAPMSASNVPATQGDGAATLPGAHIGDLDFTYASNYGQRDEGRLASDETTRNSTTAHTSEDNSSRHGATQDAASENGTESVRETTQGQEDATRTAASLDERSASTNGAERGSETRAENRAGQESTQDKRTSGHDNTAVTTTNTTDGDKYFSTGTRNDKTTEERLNRNRLTGRDGLTPQEGLRTSEEYLRRMGPAINYLIDVLETCFIGIYDI